MSSRTEKLKLRMFILSGRKACQFYKIPQSKFHPDGGAHSFRAVDMRASAVKRGSVLDDGQTESRTADLFGMTFIHTEESFKHTIQTIRRNSDAIVAYPEFGMFSPAHCDRHASARPVVFDGVFAQVIHHLVEHRRMP